MTEKGLQLCGGMVIFVVGLVVKSAGNEIRSKVSPSFRRQLPSQVIHSRYDNMDWLHVVGNHSQTTAMEIPKGKSRPDIKVREQIIKDFYAKWISENPSKSVWNQSLRAEIKVKGLSYNETIEHAARSYESTMAVFQLTDILSKAVKVSSGPKKQDDKNQKSFSRIVIMQYKQIRLVVGLQKSKGEYVQYSISATKASKDKK